MKQAPQPTPRTHAGKGGTEYSRDRAPTRIRAFATREGSRSNSRGSRHGGKYVRMNNGRRRLPAGFRVWGSRGHMFATDARQVGWSNPNLGTREGGSSGSHVAAINASGKPGVPVPHESAHIRGGTDGNWRGQAPGRRGEPPDFNRVKARSNAGRAVHDDGDCLRERSNSDDRAGNRVREIRSGPKNDALKRNSWSSALCDGPTYNPE